MRSTRCQSVLDIGEVVRFLTTRRLSDRDDPDDVVAFGMGHGDDPALQKTEADKTSLV
jgi:hypothetical protein